MFVSFKRITNLRIIFLSHGPSLVWSFIAESINADQSPYGSSTNESEPPKIAFGGEIGLSMKNELSFVEPSESSEFDESDDDDPKEFVKFRD